MFSLDKILLPVDLQHCSRAVVHQAAHLVRQFGSQIVMLHVVTPLSYSAAMLDENYVPSSLDDLMKELLRRAEKELDQFLQPELQGIQVTRYLREGDPASTIVQVARD